MTSFQRFLILTVIAVVSAFPFPQPKLEEILNSGYLNATLDLDAEEFISEEESTNIRPGYELVGDLVLPEGFYEKAATFTRYAQKWPKGQVPYVIQGPLSRYKTLILSAIKEYHDKTCVRFMPRTTHKDYILLRAGTGCNADLGVVGGEQIVNLQFGSCTNLGTIIHELGHVLGLHHEHQRSDRDDSINIFIKNVQPGAASQFTKLKPSWNNLVTPYDTDSIMQYGEKAGSKDGRLKTMTAKDPSKTLRNPVDKKVLTASDVKAIKSLYDCVH